MESFRNLIKSIKQRKYIYIYVLVSSLPVTSYQNNLFGIQKVARLNLSVTHPKELTCSDGTSLANHQSRTNYANESQKVRNRMRSVSLGLQTSAQPLLLAPRTNAPSFRTTAHMLGRETASAIAQPRRRSPASGLGSA